MQWRGHLGAGILGRTHRRGAWGSGVLRTVISQISKNFKKKCEGGRPTQAGQLLIWSNDR